LTEKYVTEQETYVGTPEVNVLTKMQVELWSSHKTWRYLVPCLLLDAKIRVQQQKCLWNQPGSVAQSSLLYNILILPAWEGRRAFNK